MSKNIVITGGTKGIGLALVNQFAQQGYHIAFCSRNEQNVQTLLSRLQQQYPQQQFLGQAVDVSIKGQLQQFAVDVQQTFSQVNVLINNAGVFEPGSIGSETEGTFERQINTNVASAYHLTRALLASIPNQEGQIINICSTASFTPYTNGGSYCISKFALLGFSKVLREELKPMGIRVSSVMPGATLTDSWAGTDLPHERFMMPEDVARAIWDLHCLPKNTVVEELILRPMQGDI